MFLNGPLPTVSQSLWCQASLQPVCVDDFNFDKLFICGGLRIFHVAIGERKALTFFHYSVEFVSPLG